MMTTQAIAELVGATLVGPGDRRIERVDSVDRADERALTFVRTAAYAAGLSSGRAAAALVPTSLDLGGLQRGATALLVVEDVDRAMTKVLAAFAPKVASPQAGVHPGSVVDLSARVDPTASIGPHCVVGPGASIGRGAVLHANVTVGREARIGAGTVLHPGVVVGDRCVVGAECILHVGVAIGADGFGYIPAPDGRGVVKVPHIGNVELGNQVEVGANTCIDRAKFGATVVGDGTKIDNLVQIGHNCRIGRCCLICGQTGLAGSVTLGDGVILAARVGITDNLTVGAGARVGAGGGVVCDVPAGETWLGLPAMPATATMRSLAAVKKLPEIIERVRELERLASRVSPGVSP